MRSRSISHAGRSSRNALHRAKKRAHDEAAGLKRTVAKRFRARPIFWLLIATAAGALLGARAFK